MLVLKHVNGYDGTGRIFEDTTIVVKDGKFEKINETVDLSDSDEVIDCSDLFITPGLIDVHTHLGIHEEGIGLEGHDYNETSAAATPMLRALDGINPREQGFKDAISSGVTTVQIMPGSANVIGGEMVILKTTGQIVDNMIVKSPSGLKAATGENPKRFHGSKGRMPVTRMGIAAILREKLIEGTLYIEKLKEGKAERNLELENIAKVLKREIPLRIHAHRADDILTALRIKDEFNINITIEHCTEGHIIAEHLAKYKDLRVSVGPTMSTRSKIELANKGFGTLTELARAGVPFSITTDHPVVGIDHLMTSAILAVKHGLTEQQAFESITLNAAKHLGIDDHVGSIEIEKDADFVLWSGNPFDLRNNVIATYIIGKQVFTR